MHAVTIHSVAPATQQAASAQTHQSAGWDLVKLQYYTNDMFIVVDDRSDAGHCERHTVAPYQRSAEAAMAPAGPA